jgi:cytochrome c oxidase assembly protein Cox11
MVLAVFLADRNALGLLVTFCAKKTSTRKRDTMSLKRILVVTAAILCLAGLTPARAAVNLYSLSVQVTSFGGPFTGQTYTGHSRQILQRAK